MAHQPYDPFRGRNSRGPGVVRVRRGPPLPFLGLIAVLPALIVSAVLVWQSRGDDPGGTDHADDTSSPVAGMQVAGAASGPAAGSDTGAGALLESATPTERANPTPMPVAATAAPPTALGLPVPELTTAAAIVVDDASMEVLYALDGYSPRPPASITKMATAVVAMEHGRLDEIVTSDVHYWDLASEADSTTMGLLPGDQLTLRELLYGLMLVSGNDAAKVIAEHVAGSEEAFVEKMNELAERLGMEDTHFVTVDGLSAPGHVSSPWDLVLLSRYLMRFPDLREIVGTEQYTAKGIREGEPVGYDLYNHNPLLNYTPGVDGIKTGYTEEAGRTFAMTAERNGHRVYIVLMNSQLRAQDAEALIDWTFANHVWPGDLGPPSPTPEAPLPQSP